MTRIDLAFFHMYKCVMSMDPNATPVVPIPNVQSRADSPIDTAYTPNYSDIVSQIDAERDGQGKASISAVTAGAPMYSPNVPVGPPPPQVPQMAPQQQFDNTWQPPPQPVVTTQNQQFEYERQGPGQTYYNPPVTAQQQTPPMEYYSSGDSDIPFYVKYRTALLAGVIFMLATVYVQPKLAPLMPTAFPGGSPNTLGLVMLAAVAAMGFHVAERTTSTI